MPLLARHGSSRRVYSPALLCHPGVNTLIDRHTAGVRRTSSKKKLWSSFRGTAVKNLLARGYSLSLSLPAYRHERVIPSAKGTRCQARISTTTHVTQSSFCFGRGRSICQGQNSEKTITAVTST
ncbi:uncharacterized protein CCOS01_00171 [Colletotrichum costaricense]|uniref:Uncharacterized protein n=1 Tax=Colletotrichum costaricense TaxID=1209916 RepID=A0AAI9Z8Y6_9PEZI|nr:uncharacterized protein CCOS01_00171 [Colletotrichum costaricense]KAK1538857.1 hypothetical protein CCOS01_00171 [Colletotrichum costaricense]